MSESDSNQRARARRPVGRPVEGEGVDWNLWLATLAELPSVGHACRVANVSRATAYLRRKEHPEFREAWDAAEENGLDRIERVALDLAAGTYVQENPDAEPPNMEAIKLVLRARRPHVYALSVKVKVSKSLAELDALPDGELFALAREAGLIGEE